MQVKTAVFFNGRFLDQTFLWMFMEIRPMPKLLFFSAAIIIWQSGKLQAKLRRFTNSMVFVPAERVTFFF